MTIAIIVAVCVVLLVLAFLMPRLSGHLQRGVDRTVRFEGAYAEQDSGG